MLAILTSGNKINKNMKDEQVIAENMEIAIIHFSEVFYPSWILYFPFIHK